MEWEEIVDRATYEGAFACFYKFAAFGQFTHDATFNLGTVCDFP
jgi:hypothetical protein